MKIPEEYPENSGITKLPTKTERLGHIISFWNHSLFESYLRYNSGGWVKIDPSKMALEEMSNEENERMERFYWKRVETDMLHDD